MRWCATLLLNSSSCLNVHACHHDQHHDGAGDGGEFDDYYDGCLVLEVKANPVWVFSDCALEHLPSSQIS